MNIHYISQKIALIATVIFSLFGTKTFAEENTTVTTTAESALKIINRFMGDETGASNALKVSVNLSLSATNGKDKYSYQLTGNELSIEASSPVAACRGFYDFVKNNKAGICSWSGNRFEMPDQWTKTSQAVFTSPYRDHQYFNVVTYGYTTPYWDEARWDQEIDWMALHGIDMPLMLVGAELVYREVFREMGLTDKEIDAWEVGPAHLPWFRMGNLAGNSFDGPLGDNWNTRQRELAKHILQRMRELGMKPVCPAFGGFVPKALRNKVSGVETVGWNWCKNDTYGNFRLSPGSATFKQIGTRFIQRWEEVFGECQYYLSDSFNEMAVPTDLNLLTQYGDNIFECIKNGSSNPKSVWVTQGWTFVYQSGEWGKNKFNALTKNIDKDRFIMLYMSPEYGNGKWNSPYEGFNGMEWNVTMLPNMGGKNFYNGGLTNYTGTYRTQYTGTNVSTLVGWGLTPEGIENNEMLYELICDAGWTPATTTMNPETWVNKYAQARYGTKAYTKEIQDFLTVLRTTVYQSYQDHKCFGWQGYNKTNGYINSSIDPGNNFFAGIETLFSNGNTEKLVEACNNNPLLRADLIEAATFYAGCKIEKLNKRIGATNSQGDKAQAHELVETLKDVMTRMDLALTAHPTYDEQKWEDKAARMGTSASDKAKYIKNARRIVTVWYGDHGTAANSHEPVNDYACRVWAGLIRDYYLPRLVAEWENIIDNKGNNLRTIENSFIKASALSAVESMESASDADLIAFLTQLVADAKEAGDFQVQKITDVKTSTDSESHWYAIRNAEPNFITRVITASGTSLSTANSATLAANDYTGAVTQYWRIFDNGDGTMRLENRSGQSMAYDATANKTVTCLTNVDTDMKMQLTSNTAMLDDNKITENSWGILPTSIASNTNTGLHINAGQGLMVWNFTVNSKYYPATCWTIEEVEKLDETYAEDYERYRRRLQGFLTSAYGDASLYGSIGQPKSAEALETAISKLGNYTAGDHEMYDEFLKKWDGIWTEAINVPGADIKAQKRKLFSLIVNTFQLTPSAVNTDANEALAAALHEAQVALATESMTDTKTRTAIKTLQTAIKQFFTDCNTVNINIGNHMPFTIKNPAETDGGDGRGTLALYTGNDGKGTNAPIAVDLVKYPSYTHTGWPSTSTSTQVFTSWAKFVSSKNNTYIYNTHNGRFLATSTNSVGGNKACVFSDTPEKMTIKSDATYSQIANASGKNLCFTPGWGKSDGYYALWLNETRSDAVVLTPVNETVSDAIKEKVEKAVAILEGTYTGIDANHCSALQKSKTYYDLCGRPVTTPEKNKVYIVDNNKVIY